MINRHALAVDLSAAAPSWQLFKHVDASLGGEGDMDALVRSQELDAATRAIAAMAERLGASLLICDHIPGLRQHFLISPDDREGQILQVDSFHQLRRFGTTWCDPVDALALCASSDRYPRRLRLGGEAFVTAVYAGYHSIANTIGTRDEVLIAEAAAQDEDGFLLAAQRLSPAGCSRVTMEWARMWLAGSRSRRLPYCWAASALRNLPWLLRSPRLRPRCPVGMTRATRPFPDLQAHLNAAESRGEARVIRGRQVALE
jgi:hypothetical protein